MLNQNMAHLMIGKSANSKIVNLGGGSVAILRHMIRKQKKLKKLEFRFALTQNHTASFLKMLTNMAGCPTFALVNNIEIYCIN